MGLLGMHCDSETESRDMEVKVLVAQSMLDSFATPWTVACQAPLSMGFPRQKYWSGLLLPSPGDLSNPGSKPISLALEGGFSTTELPEKSL